MIYTIGGELLTVQISSLGAELVSVRYQGKERLWQNENGGWAGHAPILFPYAGRCSVKVDGKVYRAITNYGARPTFHNDVVWTESYLDGFSGELYGRELTVKFVRYLREVKQFNSADELCEQLQADVQRIR